MFNKLKAKVLPEEQTNNQFNWLVGNVGTLQANKDNQKAGKQQLIHDQDVEYEESVKNDGFLDFDEPVDY